MDTNHITRFDLHGANVRLLTDEHGETWFIAKDICAVLGLGNITEALRALDDDEKGITTTDTLGGPQKTVTVRLD